MWRVLWLHCFIAALLGMPVHTATQQCNNATMPQSIHPAIPIFKFPNFQIFKFYTIFDF
jgi:hypothetical protein